MISGEGITDDSLGAALAEGLIDQGTDSGVETLLTSVSNQA